MSTVNKKLLFRLLENSKAGKHAMHEQFSYLAFFIVLFVGLSVDFIDLSVQY